MCNFIQFYEVSSESSVFLAGQLEFLESFFVGQILYLQYVFCEASLDRFHEFDLIPVARVSDSVGILYDWSDERFVERD